MSFKIVFSFAVLAVISAVPVHQQYQAEYEQPAHYEFAYEVNDEHTGDIKSQHETREGDAVKGHYELIDSDGFKRIVEYSADDVHGFVAVVHREPTNIKIPLPTPVQYSHTPVAHYSPAPVAHYAPAPVAPVHHYSPAPVHQLSYAAKPVAPVVHKQIVVATTPAPVVHYQHAAPVQHFQVAAPVHQYSHVAPVVGSHQLNQEADHVHFNAPGFNYNY